MLLQSIEGGRDMKNFVKQQEILTQQSRQLAKVVNARRSFRRFLQRAVVAGLACVAMLLTAATSRANEGYKVYLTPSVDPSTGDFKVRIAGYRGLSAHVVRTPSNSNAVGVTVYFQTSLGTCSAASGITDSNGVTGTSLWGGWGPGTATVRAKVVANGSTYSDVANVPVVKPDGETTGFVQWQDNRGVWNARLTPTDVSFGGLTLTERDGGKIGSGDTCWYSGNPWGYAKFEAVTAPGTPFGTVDANNWWGFDGVGYGSDMPANYRSGTGPTPCGTHFLQYIDVIVPGGGSANVYYTSNVLGAGIQVNTVTSERDGLSQQRTYP